MNKTLTKKEAVKGLKVKLAHYRSMSGINEKYLKLYGKGIKEYANYVIIKKRIIHFIYII